MPSGGSPSSKNAFLLYKSMAEVSACPPGGRHPRKSNKFGSQIKSNKVGCPETSHIRLYSNKVGLLIVHRDIRDDPISLGGSRIVLSQVSELAPMGSDFEVQIKLGVSKS